MEFCGILWKFAKNRLPENQKAMLSKISDIHNYNTRSSRTGLFVSTQDHGGVGYRVPKEWDSLPRGLREINSLKGFKIKSKEGFLAKYKSFECKTQECPVCKSINFRGETSQRGAR